MVLLGDLYVQVIVQAAPLTLTSALDKSQILVCFLCASCVLTVACSCDNAALIFAFALSARELFDLIYSCCGTPWMIYLELVSIYAAVLGNRFLDLAC